jgi:hypothetical protein
MDSKSKKSYKNALVGSLGKKTNNSKKNIKPKKTNKIKKTNKTNKTKKTIKIGTVNVPLLNNINITNEKIVKINYYLKLLKKQIKEIPKKYLWRVLEINDENKVEELSTLLSSPRLLKYIIFIMNTKKGIFMKKDGVEWYLRISGYKYGAKENSPRKLGLLAYTKSAKNFKSYYFYDSRLEEKLIKKIPTEYSKMNRSKYIVNDQIKYIKNNSYEQNKNYIKSVVETKSNSSVGHTTNENRFNNNSSVSSNNKSSVSSNNKSSVSSNNKSSKGIWEQRRNWSTYSNNSNSNNK